MDLLEGEGGRWGQGHGIVFFFLFFFPRGLRESEKKNVAVFWEGKRGRRGPAFCILFLFPFFSFSFFFFLLSFFPFFVFSVFLRNETKRNKAMRELFFFYERFGNVSKRKEFQMVFI